MSKSKAFIILEGADGSGKTTLAHWIAEEYGLQYRRAPTLSSTEGPDREVYEWWKDQLWGHNFEGGVYDRTFFISEFVYSLGTGRDSLAADVEMSEGLNIIIEMVDLMVFCLPPWSAQQKNLDDLGRLSLKGVDRAALKRIAWGYEYLYEVWKYVLHDRITYYDYTDMTTRHIGEAIDDLSRTSA